MKELTHEECMENPTPRMMWVWDSNEADRKKMKVVYISEYDVKYPVIVLADNDKEVCRYKHCAEIEEPKARRMTNKELSRWLREKSTREYKFTDDYLIYSIYNYKESCEDEEIDKCVVIREDDGEWREPFVEED